MLCSHGERLFNGWTVEVEDQERCDVRISFMVLPIRFMGVTIAPCDTIDETWLPFWAWLHDMTRRLGADVRGICHHTRERPSCLS